MNCEILQGGRKYWKYKFKVGEVQTDAHVDAMYPELI